MENKQLYLYVDEENDIQRIFKLTREEARAIRWFLEYYGDDQKLLEFDESDILEVDDEDF